MLLPLLVYLAPALLIGLLIRNYYAVPAAVPGPFLARLTNLYRVLSVLRFSPHEDQNRLHRQYGPLVRLGPDAVSVQGEAYVSQIYGIGKGFVKSNYYAVFQNVVNGRRTASLVAMTDETDHARTKRVVAHAYSLSTLVEYEPLVDSTIQVFLDNLRDRFGKTGKVCDFGRCLQFFAFDVIGELTFNKRLGFLEGDEDVDGIIDAIGRNFRYFSVLGQMPWLDDLLGKNPMYIKYFRKPVSSPILAYAQKLLQERLEASNADQASDKSDHPSKPDFLDRFLQARKDSDEPDLTTDAKLLSYLFMNINAGSDTIGSTLKALFHYLLTHPSTLTTLVNELTTAQRSGSLTLPVPTYHEAQKLPYLNACIHETLRLNPALSLPLERVVPAEGLPLHTNPNSPTSPSVTLKPGTIVGINPYVQHRDPSIFGADAESWRPERWLPSHTSSPSSNTPSAETAEQEALQIKRMEHALLVFGAGKRSCLGKNIAMLELSKVVPAVLLAFRMEFVGQGKWRVRNKWVLDQTGLEVKLEEW
jgi:cytochrome P450